MIGRPLRSRIDTRSDGYRRNRERNAELVTQLEALLGQAVAGGGPEKVERHRGRGKLPVRERIAHLVDPGSPWLELHPIAAFGSDHLVGASVAHGIGVISGVECLVGGSNPTVKGGASNAYSVKKTLRGLEIARINRLPLINLTESAGADLREQKDVFVPGGRTFHNLTAMSKAGVPTISVVFGNATAGGAYVPGTCDYAVMVRGHARVFLGGPPLVKMATGEDADEESLGGAEMHARVSGLCDYLADDELDALRITREIVAHLGWRKAGPAPSLPADPPLLDSEELLGVAPADPKEAVDAREVLARVLDGSRFEEFKRAYGASLVCGWGSLHGYPVGILANNGVLFSEESQKGAQFIQLCNRRDQPLLFLQNVTGFMVGTRYEQGGIIKHGAQLVNAVSNSTVPHITLMMGASYGAGNYGMSGRAYDPRFVFSWPGHRIAVMGPQQLAGVMALVGQRMGDERPFAQMVEEIQKSPLFEQVLHESSAFFASGQVWDEGVIDPRDTRTMLGMALSAVHSAEVHGTREGYGVFRT